MKQYRNTVISFANTYHYICQINTWLVFNNIYFNMYIHTCWVCRKCVIKQRNSSAIAISSPLNAVDIGKFSAIFLSDTIERFSHANELFNLRMDYINSRGGHAFHESGQFCVVLYTPCGVSETRLTSFQPWNRIKYDGDQSDYYFTLNLEPGNWSNPTLGRDEDI